MEIPVADIDWMWAICATALLHDAGHHAGVERRLKTSLARAPHMVLTMNQHAHKPIIWIPGTRATKTCWKGSPSAYFESLNSRITKGARAIAWLDTQIASWSKAVRSSWASNTDRS
jgi:hypothetical protein